MQRLLIVGLGDIARRALPALAARYELSALVRNRSSPHGVGPIEHVIGDLDDAPSLAALPAADLVVHLAPPPRSGITDPRTRALAIALSRAPPKRIVYISTSGVYGDCGGARVDEARPPHPQSDRARRRVDAERALAEFATRFPSELTILRVPGIYAADRLPIERLRQGTPVLCPADDVYTNHVHADDLASIVVTALAATGTSGVFNACDDSEITMGAWFDLIADRAGLARPPRVTRAQAAERIAAPLLSFMSESRRLVNARIKALLGVRLRYPTVQDGVPSRIDPAKFAGAEHD